MHAADQFVRHFGRTIYAMCNGIPQMAEEADILEESFSSMYIQRFD
jgi:hypothetical protein